MPYTSYTIMKTVINGEVYLMQNYPSLEVGKILHNKYMKY